MPPRNFNLILFAVVVSVLCHFTYRSARTASIVGEAIELIEQKYVDPVERQELVRAAMDGVVAKLDEHSSYFAVDAYQTFQDSIQQEFAGIGIYVDQATEGEPVRVLTPLVGSPALQAGMLPGDLIVQVDGIDVTGHLLEDVSEMLKGPVGTKVSIVVRRADAEHAMTVLRQTIELESVVGDHRDRSNQWVYRLQAEPSIAYVRLKSFGEKTVRELESVLKTLNNDFSALVIDLRQNGGGLLYAARDVSDMFLSAGKIVSTRIRDGSVAESYSATPGTLVDESIPMVVLIDFNSASASEIVAACLQDNRRATIIGTRSYGKGTVQEIMPLQYGKSALRLTVARYFRPNDQNIHRAADATEDDQWGVRPDDGFVIPMGQQALQRLATRWRDVSFPMLAGTEPLNSVVQPDSVEPPVEEEIGLGTGLADETPEVETRQVQPPMDRETVTPETQVADQQSLELTVQAAANVAAGPEQLEFDPPLRAAVGLLKREIAAAAEQKTAEERSAGQTDPPEHSDVETENATDESGREAA